MTAARVGAHVMLEGFDFRALGDVAAGDDAINCFTVGPGVDDAVMRDHISLSNVTWQSLNPSFLNSAMEA